MVHHLTLLLAWFIFAFWGVISREITLPIPILLLIITLFGFLVTLPMKQGKIISWNKTAFIVSIFLVFDLIFLFIGFRYVDFATVITLHYFAPVLVILLSNAVLKEKTNIKDTIFSIIGFFGVIILFIHELQLKGDYFHLVGIIAALASSVTLAGNIIYQRLYMKERGDYIMAVRQYNAYMFIICLVVIIPAWILFNFEKSIVSLTDSFTVKNVMLGALAGGLIQGVAMMLFNSSARFIQAKTIAKMSYTEIIWVIIFGITLYNEHLYLMQTTGIIIVLLVAYRAIRYE